MKIRKYYCPDCQMEIKGYYSKNPFTDETKFVPLIRPIKDDEGKLVWKNLFYMNWRDIVFLVIILYLAISYKMELSHYDKMFKTPCNFCKDTGYLNKNVDCSSPMFYGGQNVTPISFPSAIKG